jgi:ABC-type nickel/cobalt efflux system permease component RcnA
MKRIARLSLVVLIVVITLAYAPPAWAHPLGNFTINHYSELAIGPGEIDLDFIIDMAEIPAFQEISRIDLDRNGLVDEGESAAYVPDQCQALRSGLSLAIGGAPVQLLGVEGSLAFPPGQGGLSTLRLNCRFRAEFAAASQSLSMEYQDHTFSDRLGWREIVVAAEGFRVQGDVSSDSISNRLVNYPNDMLSSPLDQREASFELHAAGSGPAAAAGPATSRASGLTIDRNDPFTRLIQTENFTAATLLLALAISFGWGALHAMTPGHGKTIVGAYLVGSRGTALHALYLGLTTTITHTAGVFVLGGVTLLASRFLLPEKLFPWLNLLSGLLVVGIGANLLLGRLRSARRRTGPADHEHTHDYEPEASYEHHHGHAHHHDHDHGGAHPPHMHTHNPPGSDGSPVTWRSLLALGVSGGLLPCPSALVVMLGAIALERIGLGMILVLAFSVGLASVLTGIGLAFLYAGRLFKRLPVKSQVLGYVPVASAAFITLVGLGIAVRALAGM